MRTETLQRIVSFLLGIPVCVAIVALAVANRKPVTLSLDPFAGDTPAYAITVPLFAIIFGALVAGILLGSFVTWMSQGRFRRAARDARRELKRATDTAPAAPANSGQFTLPAPRS